MPVFTSRTLRPACETQVLEGRSGGYTPDYSSGLARYPAVLAPPSRALPKPPLRIVLEVKDRFDSDLFVQVDALWEGGNVRETTQQRTNIAVIKWPHFPPIQASMKLEVIIHPRPEFV